MSVEQSVSEVPSEGLTLFEVWDRRAVRIRQAFTVDKLAILEALGGA